MTKVTEPEGLHDNTVAFPEDGPQASLSNCSQPFAKIPLMTRSPTSSVLPPLRRAAAALVGCLLSVSAADAQDFEREPIEYSKTRGADCVARLMGRLERGDVKLEHDARRGYLPALLRELEIPVSSQVLVFSKTSFQRERIGPRSPRALYFNDDVYVGYVHNGEVIELAAQDPRLGTIFYTLDQIDHGKVAPIRQDAECLQCHASPLTKGVPGVLVRSVHPDAGGLPILKAGTHLTDHASPLGKRWGGWYVTGLHGSEQHMGNAFLSGEDVDPASLAAAENQNLTHLEDRLETDRYLSPHSDIVALMVLEHQTQLHNLLTSAGYQARIAMHQQEAMSGLTGDDPRKPSESTLRRFEYASMQILEYLLFVDEARLQARVRGTSTFSGEFQRLGPRDRQGRSLRDLELTRRMFKYPCSYLIYSEAFDGLPAAFKEHLYGRLLAILTGNEAGKKFSSLEPEDCRAILEILADTKPDLPEAWRREAAPSAPSRQARL